MDKETLVKNLIQRGYDEKSANLVAKDLLELDSPLNDYLHQWIEGEIITDYTIDNYSIVSFMQERSMTYPAALLTMDWIIKEPEKALKSLKSSK